MMTLPDLTAQTGRRMVKLRTTLHSVRLDLTVGALLFSGRSHLVRASSMSAVHFGYRVAQHPSSQTCAE